MKESQSVFSRLLIYLILFTFACSYPLLDLLSQNSEFFVIRRSSSGEIYLLLGVLVFALPITFFLTDLILSLISIRLANLFRGIIYSALLAAAIIIVILRIPIESGVLAVSISISVGFVLSVLLLLSDKFRSFIYWLSPIVVLAPLLFLANSNVRSILNVDKDREGFGSAGASSATPVVMIVLDEFPLWSLLDKDLAIDRERFPNFADLASRSYWFRNATAVNQFTPLAVPAILSGRYPDSTSTLPTIASYPGNVFTLLQNTHRMQALEPITQLCPSRLCADDKASQSKQNFSDLLLDLLAIYLRTIIPNDMDLGHPEIDGKWQNFWSDHSGDDWDMPEFSRDLRVKGFEGYISKLKKFEDRPSFYFSHHILPHMPLQFLPSGRAYSLRGTRGYIRNRWIDDQSAIHSGIRQYLLQVGAVDTLLGKLFSKLRELNIYDSSLIVITADHGLSFQPNTYRRGDNSHPAFYQDILSIPLFIKLPNQSEGIVSDRNVESIDILPSIADILKIELPFSVDGISVFKEPERKFKKVLIGRIPGAKARANTEAKEQSLVGKAVEINPPENFPRDSLNLKLSLPNYNSPLSSDPFYFDLHKEFVDYKVSDLKQIEDSKIKITLNEKRWHVGDKMQLKWSNKMHICPCRIQGQLTGGAELAGHTIALSVNGVIKGLTAPFKGVKGMYEVEFFINEQALIDGLNEIQFWLVNQIPANKIEISRVLSKPS